MSNTIKINVSIEIAPDASSDVLNLVRHALAGLTMSGVAATAAPAPTAPRPAPKAAPTVAPVFERMPLREALAALPVDQLLIPFGTDVATGQLVSLPLHKAMHILAAGSSGMGKSTLASCIITALIMRNDPARFNLALLDAEGETSEPFAPYARIHATDADEIVAAMTGLCDEMIARYADYRRQTDFAAAGLPTWLIFVEEALSLRNILTPEQSEVYSTALTQLAIRGRKRGMFLLCATQVDYSRIDMREAQGQFLARVTGAVMPSAARSMGFTNTEAVKKLWRDKTPGRFLLEAYGGDRVINAFQLDTRAGEVEAILNEWRAGQQPMVVAGNDSASRWQAMNRMRQDGKTWREVAAVYSLKESTARVWFSRNTPAVLRQPKAPAHLPAPIEVVKPRYGIRNKPSGRRRG